MEISRNIVTCVKDKDGIYRHFGIFEATLGIYGCKLSDIIKVRVEISEDQSSLDYVPKQADYWAWVEADGKLSNLIWSQWFLLNMCFPYGIKSAEEHGEGKAYRVKITEIEN